MEDICCEWNHNAVQACYRRPSQITVRSVETRKLQPTRDVLTSFSNSKTKPVGENISDHFPIFVQIPINYFKLNVKSKQYRFNIVHCKNKFLELL